MSFCQTLDVGRSVAGNITVVERSPTSFDGFFMLRSEKRTCRGRATARVRKCSFVLVFGFPDEIEAMGDRPNEKKKKNGGPKIRAGRGNPDRTISGVSA